MKIQKMQIHMKIQMKVQKENVVLKMCSYYKFS